MTLFDSIYYSLCSVPGFALMSVACYFLLWKLER